MTIRKATYDDLDLCVKLAKEFHSQSPFSCFRFSPSGSSRYFKSLMQSPDSIILTDGQGFIGGTVSPYPFCEANVSKESFWFVSKESRGMSGIRLLKAYLNWCESKNSNIDLVSTVEMTGQSMEGVVRLLSRHGFSVMEYNHVRLVE